MSGLDPDALDLDARELAALSAFESDANLFTELGSIQPGDDALIQRMSARAQSAGVGGGGGVSLGVKGLVLAAVVTTAIVVGVQLRPERAGEPAQVIETSSPTQLPTDAANDASVPVPTVVAPELPQPEEMPQSVAPKSTRKPATTPRVSDTPAITAADLLREGNAARTAGEHRRARDLYQRLRREFPGTREDLLVRVSLGQLALERLDDPTLALRQFTAYLADRPTGTLAEEASLGRITALRRLGKTSEEARAIDRFVVAFPDSVQVRTLQQRRDALAR